MDSAIDTLLDAAKRVSAELVPHAEAIKVAGGMANKIVSAAAAERKQDMLEELGGALGDLSEAAEGMNTFHILHQHVVALAAAAEVFMWLTDPTPSAAVKRAQEKCAPAIKALQAKKEAHAEFGDALDAFCAAVHSDVEKNHVEPLAWN